LMEGNLFDHNGFNTSVTDACATLYSHNLYIESVHSLVLRDNILSRAGSMGLKFISEPGATNSTNNLIDNNFVYDNEIGMGISGNTTGNYRWMNSTITNNVISETGLSAHTGRGLGWSFNTQDTDVGEISYNYILHQTVATNSYGFDVDNSPTYRSVNIHHNTVYAVNGLGFTMSAAAAWSGNTVHDNIVAASPSGACGVNTMGSVTGTTWSNNRYSGVTPYCQNYSTVTQSAWNAATGDTGSSAFTGTFVDSTRTLETYAATLGYANVDALLTAAAAMDRYHWDTRLTAPAINVYIKAGFVVQ
jgi:hypothetical protein